MDQQGQLVADSKDISFSNLEDTISSKDYDYQTIDLSDLSSSITMASPVYTITAGGTSGSYGAIPGAGASIGISPAYSNNMWTTNTTAGWNGTGITANPSGTITLKGEEADININGKSLLKTLEALEERLNILTPNPEMEKEWDELRELGKRYRELEKLCQEKTQMWNKLKSMPKPNIDL
jgi:hypothetical protein